MPEDFHWSESDQRYIPNDATSYATRLAMLQPRDTTWHQPDIPDRGSTGGVSLSGLPYGPAADQLVPPFLTPEGVTVLYGPGGVGKGYLAVYFSLQIVRASGKRVTIVDFENHPREWGRRAHAMEYSDDEMEMVRYLSPFSPLWTAPRGTFKEIVETLKTDLDDEQFHADYLVIDSYSTATATEEGLGGLKAAQEFFLALAQLARATLVIAHVAGGGEKWPAKPFGSVFVHNLARETWAVERIGERSDEDSEDENRAPMALELRQRKANSGVRSRPQFLTFSFEEGTVSVSREAPFANTLSDLVSEVLKRSKKSLTVKDLCGALKADFDHPVSGEALRKTLERHRERFRRTEDTPYQWALKA